MTLYVNLFGPPGAGKSTTRAGVFRRLKLAQVNVEEVLEYAKDLTWEDRKLTLGIQPYVFAKQYRNMARLKKKGLEAIVTDSPCLLSTFYSQYYKSHDTPTFHAHVLEAHGDMAPQLNYYIRRVKPYNPTGRNQTEAESDALASRLYEWLKSIPVANLYEIDGDEYADARIAAHALELLGRPTPQVAISSDSLFELVRQHRGRALGVMAEELLAHRLGRASAAPAK